MSGKIGRDRPNRQPHPPVASRGLAAWLRPSVFFESKRAPVPPHAPAAARVLALA